MTARAVLEILDRLAAAGVRVWLDGGWGVDALLGRQTRPHDDLDLVVAGADVGRLREALVALGFAATDDELPTRLVLADGRGRRIDLHPVTFDAAGSGVQVLQDGTEWRYPPDGFAGTGRVGGRSVACLTPEAQVLCHLGYDPDDDDRHDMRLLAAAFALALPAPYDA